MPRISRSFSSALAALALAVPCVSTLAAPPAAYKLFTLPATDFFSTYAEDFCGDGTVVASATSTDWVNTGVVIDRQGALVKTVMVPNSLLTYARACYQGRVMGETVVDGNFIGFYQAADGSTQLVSPADGTKASVQGTNATGMVVGYYYPNDKDNVRASAFTLKDGQFTRYDLQGKQDTRLTGITEDGTLVGNFMNGRPLRSTGFVLRKGVREDIKVAGSYDTVVTGINEKGRVVGYYSTEIGAPYRGFVWEKGQFTTFTFAKDASTYALGIDAKGRVVGYVSYPDYSQASFVGEPRKAAR